MTKETMVASTIAMHTAVEAVIAEYKLPREKALQIFSDAFQKKMRELSKEFGELIKQGKL